MTRMTTTDQAHVQKIFMAVMTAMQEEQQRQAALEVEAAGNEGAA